MSERKGIDVSKWNGNIDFKKVKEDGVEFVMIRAGHGSAEIDPYFEKNIKGFSEVGIDIGVYWFMFPLSVEEAVKEAEAFNKIIAPYKNLINYPVACDYEYDSIKYMEKNGEKATRELNTDIVYAFCEKMEEFGWYVVNYTNYDFAKNKFDMDKLKRFDIWYARWKIEKPDRNDMGIWQWTSDGSVKGINGRVDMNIGYRDYPKIIANMRNKNDKDTGEVTTKKFKELYSENTAVKIMVPRYDSNMREYAGLNFKIVDTIPKDTSVFCDGIYVIDENNSFWYHVIYNGKSGFVKDECFI